MKYIIITICCLTFLGCQNESKKISFLNPPIKSKPKEGVNPNSLAVITQEKAQERRNKIEIAKIQAEAKIESEKIKAKKDLEIAKIDSNVKKEVAQKNAKNNIELKKIEARLKEKENERILYVSIAFLTLIFLAILLWYRHKKKDMELKAKIEEEKLKHEKELKERELQEQRIHKVLELAAKGKLPKEMQKEIISSITYTTNNTIEYKGNKEE